MHLVFPDNLKLFGTFSLYQNWNKLQPHEDFCFLFSHMIIIIINIFFLHSKKVSLFLPPDIPPNPPKNMLNNSSGVMSAMEKNK